MEKKEDILKTGYNMEDKYLLPQEILQGSLLKPPKYSILSEDIIAESVPDIKLEPNQRISSAIKNHQKSLVIAYVPKPMTPKIIPRMRDFFRPSTSEK